MTDSFATAVGRFVERRSAQAGPYRLLPPAGLSEGGGPWPLVIFLHGAGERGDDNRLQLRYLPEYLASDDGRRRYPCYCLAVQCPADDLWVDVNWSDAAAIPPPVDSPAMRALRVIAADVVASEAVDPRRVYLTGISMGGFGAWHWATVEPELFAAAAPICGGGDPDRAPLLRDTPVWAVHGEQDDVVPVATTRRMIEKLRRHGGKPEYAELRGIGHDSWTPAYKPGFGLLDWMFEQRK
jgi:predicted peptidase